MAIPFQNSEFNAEFTELQPVHTFNIVMHGFNTDLTLSCMENERVKPQYLVEVPLTRIKLTHRRHMNVPRVSPPQGRIRRRIAHVLLLIRVSPCSGKVMQIVAVVSELHVRFHGVLGHEHDGHLGRIGGERETHLRWFVVVCKVDGVADG